jgi:hypothetical protein
MSEMNAMQLGYKLQVNSSFACWIKEIWKTLKGCRDKGNFAVASPIKLDSLSPTERKKIMRSLTFLSEKRGGTIKSRSDADGSFQRQWMDREDKASPTAQVESILLAAVIDAKEHREVVSSIFQVHLFNGSSGKG